MTRTFSASIWKEGKWYVAQCVEIDVASQGKTKEEALTNLREALELHFEEPRATLLPEIRQLEVELHAS
ncbi:type II toxin-antitoxin system HicB family antitoxin [candidate division KSB1 bacterium]|nr:type II toxin-antitoxin system HicB family antitoxin [candidate division KSB1 bacterium]NIR70432.1 type II toxin-antitoxin system HicB family antitoxin [candidate division KSB1 bacterium]NIS23162.1 type II toxin-antitoxin system HicB family antitoxin [candidate division KSB1 bacterium]NIT70021.1 type II toxin-antitoxin system HicB family antitoxin [candidate division KSB1 bacterium]NIU23659.1 type II toxin-antitoxin system HicB family antitoxin [candidate division KSB1 bacterium]